MEAARARPKPDPRPPTPPPPLEADPVAAAAAAEIAPPDSGNAEPEVEPDWAEGLWYDDGKAGLRGLRMVGVQVPGVRVPAVLVLLAGLRTGVPAPPAPPPPPNAMGERPSIGDRDAGGPGECGRAVEMLSLGVRGVPDLRSWWRTLSEARGERYLRFMRT